MTAATLPDIEYTYHDPLNKLDPNAPRSTFRDPNALTASLPEYTGPTTRAGVLAEGKVKIVKTPEELTAARKWWGSRISPCGGAEFRSGAEYMSRRDFRLEMQHAIKPVKAPATPAEVAAKQIKDASAQRKKYGAYIGGKRFTPPSEMSPSQLKNALKREMNRLDGLADDTDATEVTILEA
jgi:hypothetical protein